MEDITLRALKVLREVNLVLAEDTRTSSNLFRHFEINTRLVSHHKFNEHKTVSHIAEQILAGDTIALISDAGTPSISDPGYLLTRTCIERGIAVECLPGATAFVPALVNSGFPSDKFCFEGFLPQKKGRQKRLTELAAEKRTMIFYESPFRLIKTLEQFGQFFGESRMVSVSREISKLYEETFRGTVAEVVAHFRSKAVKGEIVMVVQGAPQHKEEEDEA